MYKVINIAESSWWPDPSAYITPRKTAWPGITIHIITIDAFICGFAKSNINSNNTQSFLQTHHWNKIKSMVGHNPFQIHLVIRIFHD